MTDTHTHIYFPDYGQEISEVVKRSLDCGVKHFILPNVDVESIGWMKMFHEKFPEISSLAIGLHPTEVKEDWKTLVDLMKKELISGNYIAVGEIGMDLYWDKTFIEQQKEAFATQLRMAQEHEKPVIIHSRDALDEILEIIEMEKPNVPLIFHSFTGNKEDVDKIRNVCDPYFGINGVVTYKNAPSLREAIPLIGIKRILLETDAPYLTPVPHRGKRNESSYLTYICTKVAETLGLTPEEVEDATDNNAKTIFGL